MNLDRRSFLQSLAVLPWLPRWLTGPVAGPQRSLILLWMDGGMSHLDTFDGKPEAPPDIRGELRSVESDLAGVFVSEHLPRLRKTVARCSVIRTLTSGEGNHDRGSHYLLTGHRPSAVLVHPSLGSLRSAEALAEPGPMPAYVAIPLAPEYGWQGFLPLLHGPFELGAGDSRPDLMPRAGADRALDLLARVDALDGAPRSEGERARDHFLARAQALSLDPDARAVFDLGRERPETRARYGPHQLGQACLLARRLVHAGVRTVLVRDTGWDHHVGLKNALTYGFPPKLAGLDQALAALADDLDRTGLSDRVVVCLASEFGRTPRLNPSGGRDHWPRAHSAVLFGAGIRRGCVVGRTDARGEEPAERPVSPADLFATLLAALGADLATVLRTPDGRPVRILEDGAAPVREVLEA
jgi:hypothetical protein